MWTLKEYFTSTGCLDLRVIDVLRKVSKGRCISVFIEFGDLSSLA